MRKNVLKPLLGIKSLLEFRLLAFMILMGTFVIIFCGCNQKKCSRADLERRIDSLENIINRYQTSGGLLDAVYWYQSSPEMQALYLQSYNVAQRSLAQILSSRSQKAKTPAVVVDIDETVLSNDLYEAWLIASGTRYCDSTWCLWVEAQLATPLPGSLDFLLEAQHLGCEVFYISNRKENLFEATLQNLQKYNYPFADSVHLLLKTEADTNSIGKSSKQKRRDYIENQCNCEIVMFCGDQMTDFHSDFENLATLSDKEFSEKMRKFAPSFGYDFIVLPNPMYNDFLLQKQKIKKVDREEMINKWNN